jgi:hypothetical protein
VHQRPTQAAATALGGFTRPVLLAWAPEDRPFPISLAQRLAVLAQLVLSAVIEGALLIAAAEDPAAARANTEQALAAWFLGLHSARDAGPVPE